MHIDHDTEKKIDQICLEFEDDLRHGQGHSIEACLALVTSELRDRLLRELLRLELDYSSDPPDVESIVSRFPEFEQTIRECLRASMILTPHRLQAGDRVGRYVVQELLGEGTFGLVYKAWDEKLKRSVAIKSPRLIGEATHASSERFQREAVALARLQHTNIVAIHDVLSDQNGWPLLILEHVEAQPLNVKSDQAELVKHLTDVAEAMDYVHRQGIVHRDLKPSNILIDSDGRAVVADFGLSLHTDVQHERCGESAGTIRYMSPELIRGESHWVDGRADIWSLGVILYEAIAGTQPFKGDDYETVAQKILDSPAKPPRQSDPACPVELEEICLKCLRRSPEDRYATARDLANALRRYQTKPMRGGIFRNRLSIALAVACLCLLFATAYPYFIRGAATKPDNNPAVIVRAERIPATIRVNVRRDIADGSARLRLETAIPLQDGDSPEIEVRTTQPCRFWIVWIDTNGKVVPVYPWIEENWDLFPDKHDMVTELYLDPPWKLSDLQSGAETLLVLGNTSAAGLHVDVRSLLRGWKPQSRQLAYELEYDFGMPIQSTLRSELKSDPKLKIPLFENPRMFREPRFQQFSLCRSIFIPVGGATR